MLGLWFSGGVVTEDKEAPQFVCNCKPSFCKSIKVSTSETAGRRADHSYAILGTRAVPHNESQSGPQFLCPHLQTNQGTPEKAYNLTEDGPYVSTSRLVDTREPIDSSTGYYEHFKLLWVSQEHPSC